MTRDPPRILTQGEAARLIGLSGTSTETLRRWRKQNIGPPFVQIGSVAYYRSDLLDMSSGLQGEVGEFPPSREEIQTLNQLLLLRLLLLQVSDHWIDGEGYHLTLDSETHHYRSVTEVQLYLKTLNKLILKVESERVNAELELAPNRVLAILNQIVVSEG